MNLYLLEKKDKPLVRSAEESSLGILKLFKLIWQSTFQCCGVILQSSMQENMRLDCKLYTVLYNLALMLILAVYLFLDSILDIMNEIHVHTYIIYYSTETNALHIS